MHSRSLPNIQLAAAARVSETTDGQKGSCTAVAKGQVGAASEAVAAAVAAVEAGPSVAAVAAAAAAAVAAPPPMSG